ncbi:putative ureD urease accessory protein [Lyophyllum shimeji]|uniref:UreD urease accessory protein n=1 Tax=Lyophyllum shimeji TaxID=47721 RepID=A0A9P3PIG9_LYOSH|nr:putative ureD urease accessory protein [Lyophyllum shimeji]
MQPLHSPIPRLRSGGGRISLTSYGTSAVFSELASTYPLKVLSPRIVARGLAVVYLLTYGGGLVGGDQIELSVKADSKTVLVLLSQGSTKVFKIRPGRRLASPGVSRHSLTPPTSIISPLVTYPATRQNMTFTIAAEGALFLLPDPVTCFRSASYNQSQTFYLSKSASLVVLDWLTSGRMSMGEEWAFSRYYSANEVWVEGKRIAKDIMLLDDQQPDPIAKILSRTLADRLAPYSCYAMVMLFGPLVQSTIQDIAAQFDQIAIFKTKRPAEMVWSLSPMTSESGAIVRVAGKETESVRTWLGQALLGLQETVGIDVYRKAFP